MPDYRHVASHEVVSVKADSQRDKQLTKDDAWERCPDVEAAPESFGSAFGPPPAVVSRPAAEQSVAAQQAPASTSSA